jgi:hypothetical protein
MSFFYLKSVGVSISAMVANTATQVIGTTESDITIFSSETLAPIATSSIYPIITVSSATITLEQGWKYFLDARMKVVTATPLVADATLRYVFTNTSDQVLSSEGRMTLWRSGSGSVSQEKCCLYIDATSSSQSIKIRGNKIGTSSTVTINAQDGVNGTTFRSHILIKAWR